MSKQQAIAGTSGIERNHCAEFVKDHMPHAQLNWITEINECGHLVKCYGLGKGLVIMLDYGQDGFEIFTSGITNDLSEAREMVKALL